jgi:hypothetical protein
VRDFDEIPDRRTPDDFNPRPGLPEPPPPFKCEPPYHRPDCEGANCDDEATRERCDPF